MIQSQRPCETKRKRRHANEKEMRTREQGRSDAARRKPQIWRKIELPACGIHVIFFFTLKSIKGSTVIEQFQERDYVSRHCHAH